MSGLKQLLYSDLSRQYELEGKAGARPNFVGFVARLFHYRFLPNVICRISRAAYVAGLPIIPNLFTYLNLLMFGLEVTPRCEIGPGVFFAHTYGTVVGGSRIGSRATIFQGVTIGSKTLEMRFDLTLRPNIGDNVVLGAGCKVLGGIHLGNGVTVGANAVVLESVEDNATVVGIPARVVDSRDVCSFESIGERGGQSQVKVLVTGGAGFIGTHLCRKLLQMAMRSPFSTTSARKFTRGTATWPRTFAGT